MYKIDHYKLKNGSKPFVQWIKALKDIKGRAKINVYIDRVSLGNFSKCKPVKKGVCEIKIDYGPG